MPIISRFYGIIIKMYFFNSEHNPPHIHAVYNDFIAAITIQEGNVISGSLPPKALVLVFE